jgi:hypothetical protein
MAHEAIFPSARTGQGIIRAQVKKKVIQQENKLDEKYII